MISTIITAGGSSSRFKNINKLLYQIKNHPIIYYTVKTFDELDFIDEIIIPSNIDIIDELREIFKNFLKVKIIPGGLNRQESVYKGLKECTDCKYVIIHDGARPFVKKDIIIRCLEKAKQTNAAIAAVKTVDTIKIVDENMQIISTPDRNTLWNAQTPQIFDFSTILRLHEKYKGQNFTDDSLLYEQEGLKTSIVESEYSNFKITTTDDLSKIKNCL